MSGTLAEVIITVGLIMTLLGAILIPSVKVREKAEETKQQMEEIQNESLEEIYETYERMLEEMTTNGRPSEDQG